jgi:hypothetical protein
MLLMVLLQLFLLLLLLMMMMMMLCYQDLAKSTTDTAGFGFASFSEDDLLRPRAVDLFFCFFGHFLS